MSDFEQLKPCPFCGGGASEGSVGSSVPGSDDDGYLYIECPQCNGAYGKPFIGVHGDDKDVLRGIWNTRSAKQSMQGEPLRINLGDGKHGVHYGTIEELPCLTISTKGVGEVGKPTTHKNNTEMELESEVMSVTFANHKSYTVFKNIVDSIPIYSDNTHAPDSAARIAELEQQLEVARRDAERYQWLRNGGKDLGGEVIIYGYSPKGLDESIDAAIRQIGGAE